MTDQIPVFLANIEEDSPEYIALMEAKHTNRSKRTLDLENIRPFDDLREMSLAGNEPDMLVVIVNIDDGECGAATNIRFCCPNALVLATGRKKKENLPDFVTGGLKIGNVPYIRIDGNDPAEENAQKMMHAVEMMGSGARVLTTFQKMGIPPLNFG